MRNNTVICVGCAFWDTIFRVEAIPNRGTKVLPEEAVQVGAGMATAAAATIARFGGAVELWTRIGDDATGNSFLRDLSGEGVEASGVRRIRGARTPFSTILVDRKGEKLVVPYTDPTLDRDPGWLPLHRVTDAGAVLADVRWIEGARSVLTQARRDGVPSVLDADIAPPEILRSLAALADHVLFSEPALLSLVNTSSPRDALLRIASELDAQVVGVTLGEHGALIWQRSSSDSAVHHFPSIPVEAVDTLSAGDVWHGAYAYGLVQQWSLARSVRIANVAAAMKCERFGGRLGTPRLGEVFERLRKCTIDDEPG